MSINKLKNIWVSNDTSLTGPNQTVSLLNEGKSEFKDNCVIDTKLSINKGIDNGNDYKLDVNGDSYVNGNINYTGMLNGIKSTSLNINSLLTANLNQYTLASPYYSIYFFNPSSFTSNIIINFPFSNTVPNGLTFSFLTTPRNSSYDIIFKLQPQQHKYQQIIQLKLQQQGL